MNIDQYRKEYQEYIAERKSFQVSFTETTRSLVESKISKEIEVAQKHMSENIDSGQDLSLYVKNIDDLNKQKLAVQETVDFKSLDGLSFDKRFFPDNHEILNSLSYTLEDYRKKIDNFYESRDKLATMLAVRTDNEPLIATTLKYVECIEELRFKNPNSAATFDNVEIPLKPIVATIQNHTADLPDQHGESRVYMFVSEVETGREYVVPEDIEVRMAFRDEPLRFEPWRNADYIISLPSEPTIVGVRDPLPTDVEDVCLASVPARNGCCGDVGCICGPDSGPSAGVQAVIDEHNKELHRTAKSMDEFIKETEAALDSYSR